MGIRRAAEALLDMMPVMHRVSKNIPDNTILGPKSSKSWTMLSAISMAPPDLSRAVPKGITPANNMMTLQLTELNASSGVRLLVISNITTPMIALTTTGKMLSAAVTTTPSNVNRTIQVLLVLLGVIPTSDTRIKEG